MATENQRETPNKRVLIFTSCALVTLLLLVCLPVGGVGYLLWSIWDSETKGPYFNSTSPADLDGDGDLDMVVFTLREEAESILWGGFALYFNRGDGQFDYFQPDMPPVLYISGDSGDLDGDGDVDILLLSPGALFLLRNQGGELQGWKANSRWTARSTRNSTPVHLVCSGWPTWTAMGCRMPSSAAAAACRSAGRMAARPTCSRYPGTG